MCGMSLSQAHAGRNPRRRDSSGRTPIIDQTPRGPKVVGVLTVREGSLVLEKSVSDSHILRRSSEWAISMTAIEAAQQAHARAIVLLHQDGNVWRITLEEALRVGREVDFGYGRQLAVSLNAWDITVPGDDREADPPPAPLDQSEDRPVTTRTAFSDASANIEPTAPPKVMRDTLLEEFFPHWAANSSRLEGNR